MHDQYTDVMDGVGNMDPPPPRSESRTRRRRPGAPDLSAHTSRRPSPPAARRPHVPWTLERVRAERCVVVDGLVYDVRPMMREHPSGAAVIERHLGTDISRVFRRVRHSEAARAWLARLCVGHIAGAKA